MGVKAGTSAMAAAVALTTPAGCHRRWPARAIGGCLLVDRGRAAQDVVEGPDAFELAGDTGCQHSYLRALIGLLAQRLRPARSSSGTGASSPPMVTSSSSLSSPILEPNVL